MSIVSWFKSLFFRKNEQEAQTENANKLDFSLPTKVQESPGVNPNASETKVGSESKDFVDKAKEFAAETGKEIAEQSSALWGAVKEKMEDLDDGTKEFRENIKNKANQTLEKIDEFVDDVVEKSKKMDEEEKVLDKDSDGLADSKIDFGKPIDQKHEGFFDKAEKWLESNDQNPEAAVTPKDGSSKDRPTLELPKE
jgi:ElaB/YqjD/DUF883 family membrane-anchored ribosome-binding protein